MSQLTFTHPLDDPTADPFQIAALAAAEIAQRTGVEKHDIALTLGSGWAKSADLIGETTATIPAHEITGFGKPALAGHVGTLRSVLLPGGKRALVIGARTHYYEGHGVRRVVHSVRTAAATGASAARPRCAERIRLMGCLCRCVLRGSGPVNRRSALTRRYQARRERNRENFPPARRRDPTVRATRSRSRDGGSPDARAPPRS